MPHPSLHRLVAAAAATALLAGCAATNDMTPEQKGTATGAGAGALAGALLGQAIGRDTKGTLIGAGVGAVAGAIGGNIWSKNMEEKKRAMEQATAGTGIEVSRTADNQLKLNVPNDISFATGSAALDPRLRPVLDSFAGGLTNQPAMIVKIVGHTHSTGSDAINDPLSHKRAESVRHYLEDRGISGGRVETAGRGSREPVAGNDSAESRARNRRVEIFLREPAKS